MIAKMRGAVCMGLNEVTRGLEKVPRSPLPNVPTPNSCGRTESTFLGRRMSSPWY